jgi:hypothetical protein
MFLFGLRRHTVHGELHLPTPREKGVPCRIVVGILPRIRALLQHQRDGVRPFPRFFDPALSSLMRRVKSPRDAHSSPAMLDRVRELTASSVPRQT